MKPVQNSALIIDGLQSIVHVNDPLVPPDVITSNVNETSSLLFASKYNVIFLVVVVANVPKFCVLTIVKIPLIFCLILTVILELLFETGVNVKFNNFFILGSIKT